YELDPALAEFYDYQPRHGYWALGTGGLVGVGLGASREKWAYLPEAHNDYIFAIIGEELGLLGTLAILGLYALLAWAIFRLRTQLTDRYQQLVVTGLGVWIIGQALVNIYVVLGMMAVVGVPLPLISAGGSSLVATCCAIGILLSCARSEPGAQSATLQSPAAVRRSHTVITRRGKDA
ncbi:MAG: FtsW/RodA/SpoVE family cell cycle protein, partial [Bowdeniella nasicola]|nr:FtsW/RodA/SpoVE family cell cycle protein [Bowdeniella nasicola]